MDNDKNFNNREVMKNILSLLKGYKLKLFISIIFIIISVFSVMYTPLLIGDAITIVLMGQIDLFSILGLLTSMHCVMF